MASSIRRQDKPRTPGTRPLSSATKLLALLDLIATSKTPVQLAKLAAEAGAARAAVHKQLVTLVEAGWLEQLDDRSYRLTMRAAHVGQAALVQAGLDQRVLPEMERLAAEVRESTALAVLDGSAAHIVQRVEGDRLVRVDARWELGMPLAHSASGKVLVAFASEARLARLEELNVELPDAVAIEAVRRAGYALSSGQWPEDAPRAVAAPIFDASGACTAALSIAAPETRFDEGKLSVALLAAAERVNSVVIGRSA